MLHQSIKIALADDHVLFRKTLSNYLSQQETIDVIFGASDGIDLLSKLKKNPVDILLVDLLMPRITGANLLTIIRNEYPHIKAIVLSMYSDIGIVNDLLDVGIYGYISKAEEPEEVIKAIKAVSENRIYRNSLFTEALYNYTKNNIKTGEKNIKIDFTEREKKIIQLLWEEKNNKEIADTLFLGVRSIEKIRQDLKEKLGVKTTIGLLKYALQNKIINIAAPKLMQHN